MKIGFIGDCHANWDDLYQAIVKLEQADMLIQVGDLGFWPDKLDALKLTKKLYWIDGNHEHFEQLKLTIDFNRLEAQETAPNLWYLPRGIVLELGGLNFAFLGGARSIDRLRRIEGSSWFQDELPSYEEYRRLFYRQEQIDVMVTHDAPEWAMEQSELPLIPDFYSQKNRETLDLLYDQHKPYFWFHGHYHRRYQAQQNKSVVMGLACAPDCIIFDTTTKTLVEP